MRRLLIVALALAGCAVPKADVPAHARPNIIVIVTDDAGYADFGFTGVEDFETPAIDALAASGTVCTQGYVTASVCSPSRAGLITGRYQQRSGYEMNIIAGRQGYRKMGLDAGERTVAELLQADGYDTAAMGKWHLGSAEINHPTARGFDRFRGYIGGSRSYRQITKQDHWRSTMEGTAFVEEPDDFYVTDDLGQHAAAWVDLPRDAPFFLYLSFTAVHTPMHANKDDRARYAHIENPKRRTLAAMTRALDRAIGDLMQAVDQRGLRDDTLVFFINDNGGATNNGSDNGPLRGMKGSAWEGGIRVPFVVSWPGHIPSGAIYDQPVSALDITGTILGITGIAPPRPIDGMDLVPYLDGRASGPPHDCLCWRRGPVAAIRQGQWKLIRVDDGRVLLLDVEHDPSETRDLAAEHPDVVAHLSDALEDWESELAPMRWPGREKYMENQRRKHDMTVVGRDAERRLP